ncbi:GNAT family protein [Evansella sp. AB-P1]|uniref:GNAT family N-acetyltransferase n=1 Tax=Evansella sp. AB-P1 TaxID=3037653 RepID=UPI00241D322E|nr:GNAT family protein [Evansella sp. AB-P1]MDG5788413.1 GNAT family protein [Evansella sp. AB-P1]
MFLQKIDDMLSIRSIELQDAEELFDLTDRSRSYLRKWLPWLDTNTELEHTKDFILFSMKGYMKKKMMNHVVIYDGNIVGVAGYNEIDWSNRIAYIGYWLGEDYQGKGIITKVTRTLIIHAFFGLHLNRVDIRAAVENKKSRSIPERLGFVQEGRIRQAEWLYDHFVDHTVYSMLAEEWFEKDNEKYLGK